MRPLRVASIAIIVLTAHRLPVAAQFPVGDARRTTPPREQTFIAPTTDSDERMYEWYERTTLDAISRFRRQLTSVLPDAYVEKEKAISYEVQRSPDPSVAEATSVAGRRVIRISVGFVRLLETLVEAQAVAYTSNNTELALRYFRYFADALNQGAARVRQGQTPATIQLFPQWMGWTESERLRNWNDPRTGMQRSQSLYGAFAFVVAHETGHHVLGHKAYRDKTVAEARADETAADSFAADMLVKLELPPNAAVALIGFWSVLGSNPLERETTSTHPADERRLFALLDRAIAMVADDPDFKKYLRENGLVDRWNAAQEASRAGAREIAKFSSGDGGAKQTVPWGSIRFGR